MSQVFPVLPQPSKTYNASMLDLPLSQESATETRETKLLEAWTKLQLQPLKDSVNILTSEDPVILDLVKFWGLLVVHIGLSEVPTIALEKRSKDALMLMLDNLQPILVEFLMGSKTCMTQFLDKVTYARALSVKIVGRMVIGRKPRTSIGEYPPWISIPRLTRLIKNILRAWEGMSNCSHSNFLEMWDRDILD